MDTILVIGATGQLGTAVTRLLHSRGMRVRALVRDTASAAWFRNLGVETATGDLNDPGSLERACHNTSAIVATATAAVPTRKADSFRSVDLQGYNSLIRIAREAGVRRFIFTSVPVLTQMHLSPVFRYKRATEETLLSSGLQSVIFRADLFMDICFAMMGSTIPLRGSEAPTLLRQFPFVTRYFARISNSIETKHLALIPGTGTTHHAFICVADVAAFLVAAVHGPTGIYDIGGPQNLTFSEVVHLYERVLGTSLRTKRMPAAVFRAASSVLKPFSPAAANLMMLNYLSATKSTQVDSDAAATFGVSLTSAEMFLRHKLALAATASSH